MTQFASTLYPQTNPTNPILLDFRRWQTDEYFTRPRLATTILQVFDNLLVVRGSTPSQQRHARLVLERMANLSG